MVRPADPAHVSRAVRRLELYWRLGPWLFMDLKGAVAGDGVGLSRHHSDLPVTMGCPDIEWPGPPGVPRRPGMTHRAISPPLPCSRDRSASVRCFLLLAVRMFSAAGYGSRGWSIRNLPDTNPHINRKINPILYARDSELCSSAATIITLNEPRTPFRLSARVVSVEGAVISSIVRVDSLDIFFTFLVQCHYSYRQCTSEV